MESQNRPVKNHMCNGLYKFQNRINSDGELDPGYGCIPIFDPDGTCVGCDSTNYMKILYCPFCGVRL